MWRLLLGIVVNLLLLGSTVLLAGVGAGWIYGWLVPQLRWYCGNPNAPYRCDSTHVVPSTWTLIVLAALVGVAFLVGIASVFATRPRNRRICAAMTWFSWGALLAGVAWAVFVLGVPQLLAWLHRITVAAAKPNKAGEALPVWSLAGIGGVLASAAGLVAPVLRWVRAAEAQESWVGKLLRRIWKPALNLLMLISIPLFLAGGFVWFATKAAADPPVPGAHSSLGAIALWAGLAGGAIVLWLLAWRISDLNRWSLHAIYEERLGDAFGVERCPPHAEGSPTVVADEAARSRPDPLQLSQSQPDDLPEVLVCATANEFRYGIAPTARGAVPFLFSAATVGSRDDGEIAGASETDRYELWGFNKPTDLSLTTAISISGAAVAPFMGKMTRRPLRFLLALANIRLGVWLPKPARLDRFGFVESRTPGPSYLLIHEMLGIERKNSAFVYVTDGGHYDNLGLIELFLRRCEWIWCIDASGDDIDTFSTLGGALAMAEAECGVVVDIDPQRDMAPAAAGSRFVRQPFCFGSVTYLNRRGNVEKNGVLVVVKAGVPENAPWSVRSYHADHEEFPCDPTLNQIYTADRFNAYVELGRFAMGEAWAASFSYVEANES